MHDKEQENHFGDSVRKDMSAVSRPVCTLASVIAVGLWDVERGCGAWSLAERRW